MSELNSDSDVIESPQLLNSIELLERIKKGGRLDVSAATWFIPKVRDYFTRVTSEAEAEQVNQVAQKMLNRIKKLDVLSQEDSLTVADMADMAGRHMESATKDYPGCHSSDTIWNQPIHKSEWPGRGCDGCGKRPE